ncbi:MAG: hypothetical protein DRQ62_07075 [Gammaproteobacteria bacterium]|nr:MAG: hypothetical protein DRQ62_07075 [Gammaproteobacteria bacterium]
MPLTTRDFVQQAYRLISAQSPSVTLHGDDLSLGITILNQLVQSFAATGLMLTIAKQISVPLPTGTTDLICADAGFLPTPDITEGRLANLDNAWLELEGVTYPLIEELRSVFLASFKYDPLLSLPRFIIVMPDTNSTRLRIYPAPSQNYTFHMRGKFQLNEFTSNTDMTTLPQYYQRFLLFALARDLAPFKGRSEAWTPNLETIYNEAKINMESASEINVAIAGDRESLLSGAFAVRAGV